MWGNKNLQKWWKLINFIKLIWLLIILAYDSTNNICSKNSSNDDDDNDGDDNDNESTSNDSDEDSDDNT